MNLLAQETRPRADDTRLIPLTQGQFATVDAADFEWLSQWKWFAHWNSGTQSFYAHRNEKVGTKQRTVPMHRAILGLEFGDPRQGDHRESGNTLDNRRANLRIATKSQNAKNRRTNRNNTSKLKGVMSHGNGRYEARISVNGEFIRLGSYSSPEEAHAAYREAAQKYHGEFSNPGKS